MANKNVGRYSALAIFQALQPAQKQQQDTYPRPDVIYDTYNSLTESMGGEQAFTINSSAYADDTAANNTVNSRYYELSI